MRYRNVATVLLVASLAVTPVVGTQAVSAAAADAPPVFGGLGAWVDLFDRQVNPTVIVARMKRHGVRTLYLQTSRYTSKRGMVRPAKVGRWLQEAHAKGIQVVGWYLPAYSEFLEQDVKRTIKIARFERAGHTFDGLAVDIEYKGKTDDADEFNAGIIDHLERVRDAVGDAYPVGAIVPAPIAMKINPQNWRDFPWTTIGAEADVVLPMAYWSYRLGDGRCPAQPKLYCANSYGRRNARAAGNLTGLPVHIIGGIADVVTNRQVRNFVKGSLKGGAIGGGLYDVRTTRASTWPLLGPYIDA